MFRDFIHFLSVIVALRKIYVKTIPSVIVQAALRVVEKFFYTGESL
jgi:hypothetical protein